MKLFICRLLMVAIIFKHQCACGHPSNAVSHNEDDDIIKDAMTSLPRQKKRFDVPYDDVVGVPHITVQRTDTPGVKRTNDVDKIVGDVNKYGLWEYTADNTGMGEQLKKMMSKVQVTEVPDPTYTHSLEKQANRINEQINKYAEGNADPSPTIDPMETPEGFMPTGHQPSPDISPINSRSSDQSVDVVTIPSTMTIEDEHGNNLDNLQLKSFSYNAKPTKSMSKLKSMDEKFPTHSMAVYNPTSKLLKVKPRVPTTSLTQKLLEALKSSRAFRNTAQDLLPAPSDSETDLFRKQRKLTFFLKAYEKLRENENRNTKKTESGSDLLLKQDWKLLSVIKKLIKDEDDSAGQRNQLHDLLSALKESEHKAGKLEHEFYDTSGSVITGGDATLSEPYQKHFKEFLEKNKKGEGESSSSVDLDHPLGTSGASPLMGYLEQETAAMNSIKDSERGPKVEFQKLETMLNKQKTEQEELQKTHDKIMLEQFKKLLKEERESESKENNKLTDSHMTGAEIQTALDKEISTYGDDIYNKIKNSTEYQNFLSSPEDSHIHAKDTTDISSGDGREADEAKSVEEQLKEIEEQKNILKKKEEKLKLLKEKQKHNTANITVSGKEEKLPKTPESKLSSEEQKKNESEAEAVDHLLHLANPQKNENTKIEAGTKVDSKEGKTDHGSKSVSLQSEEQYEMIDAHQQALKQDVRPEQDDTTAKAVESALGSGHKDASETDSHNAIKLTKKMHKVKLGLPINNPAPKDDLQIEPHPNFHNTYHSKVNDDDVKIQPSKPETISPIHSPFHSKNRHLTSLSETEEKTSDSIPPAGMGKPRLTEGHHVFPIEEPPPLVSFHSDTNHHAIMTPAEEGEPNTISNLLKHKSIPKLQSNVLPSSPLHISPYERIITPKSHKMIDVNASKKGFGRPPRKPKSYLLRELRDKLKLFAAKRRLRTALLKNMKHSNVSINTNQSVIIRTLTNQTKHNKNTTERGFVIPLHRNSSNVHNVLVPSSVRSKFHNDVRKVIVDNIDPTDITRSKLPKVVKKPETHPSIEDVFNMLDSEDQINARHLIVKTKNP